MYRYCESFLSFTAIHTLEKQFTVFVTKGVSFSLDLDSIKELYKHLKDLDELGTPFTLVLSDFIVDTQLLFRFTSETCTINSKEVSKNDLFTSVYFAKQEKAGTVIVWEDRYVIISDKNITICIKRWTFDYRITAQGTNSTSYEDILNGAEIQGLLQEM